VKSRTTKSFRAAYQALPEAVQRQARQAYQLFRQNPSHPGLSFKQVEPVQRLYSVRISLSYRALGFLSEGEVVWFWIGTHADYDRILSRR
jgi:hypothetical protein